MGGGPMRSLKGFSLLCVFLAGGCAYTFPRQWMATSQPVNIPRTGETIRPPQHPEDFRLATRACVAENDPDHLHDLDQGGDYQTSGWFLSDEKLSAFHLCMHK